MGAAHMKILPDFNTVVLCIFLLLFSLGPDPVCAQSGAADESRHPVAQKLIREGAFAVSLLPSLELGETLDEISAEERLGEAGITPRNGWIADYPVTPDIVGELRKAVAAASQSGRLKLDRDEAIMSFEEVTDGFDLPIRSKTVEERAEAPRPKTLQHPDTASINKYFEATGPPVITYYEPPGRYSHLYSTVPYSFTSNGLSFPRFFILKSFHRTVFENGRVAFVSNGFHVFRKHREFIIDPLARFNGKTYAGIGVAKGTVFKTTGICGNGKRVFNGPQPWVRGKADKKARGGK
jgi:hypothetical protein